ncbi:MAG: RNA methyltransferase [Candidatus Margulisbacteria bacterium]|nr:RNA methyltransferase [Candidatus Margulisiibacteriota bacterium]
MKEKLRLVRTLLEKRNARRKEGRFVVEGPHLVEEAVDQLDFVIYSEQLPLVSKLADLGVDCYKVSKKQFAEVSDVETPQGILAVVKQRQFQLSDLFNSVEPLIVFCVEVQDPGNLGTIIRTADAVGAAGVVLAKGTVDLYNSKVIRSTMGSLFHLPIVMVPDTVAAIEQLKKQLVRLIAADILGSDDYFDVDYIGKTAILVGNEGAGLPTNITDLCDQTVKIPMPGRAESLNVGVSTAVVLYEALRQRMRGRFG